MKTMPEANQNQPGQSPKNPQTTSGITSTANKAINIIIAVLGIVVIVGISSYFLLQKNENMFGDVLKNITGRRVDISRDGDKTAVETEQGKATAGKSEVPNSFPSDISIYKGATVTESVESELGISIILETKDSVTKVTDFYKADLAKNGWKITETTTVSGSFALTTEGGSKKVVVVVAPGKEGKTNISISVTSK